MKVIEQIEGRVGQLVQRMGLATAIAAAVLIVGCDAGPSGPNNTLSGVIVSIYVKQKKKKNFGIF